MKEFICIECPKGCRLTVDDDLNVTGNTCNRGKVYAILNDVEFEYLCQDIMQQKLDTELRRFARGKDGGIDLTDDVHLYSSFNNFSCIIDKITVFNI